MITKTGLQIHELKKIETLIRLTGKIAFITGAAGGIGRASASAMAQAGADLCLTDLGERIQDLEEVAACLSESFKVRVEVIPADLTEEAGIAGLIQAAAERMGTLHIVHSNAGISSPEDHADMPMEFWHKMVATNLTSNLLVARESAGVMRRNQHPGSIILTASMSGSIINRRPPGQRHAVGYCTAKAGVRQMARGLAMEFLQDGIRVNSISPGYVLSGLHEKWSDEMMEYVVSHIPMGRFADLNEVMGPVLFLASDMSSYCTGTDICFDGGFTVW